ncbi:AraC family transcriptional regulator [Sphingomonas oleivorans]|uniref:AraC family transcriptional regulator n=1 Tax=Sphingomonas oleivorans TaxID=1735121 RepID=A0A2T5FZE7_9SPHN|nr:AraC family transcriptional regulator [Sphingomonas oleivorans]PTQ12045.1 AraC family transcriptional regulator [Sphingomonas oleivorans]
MASQGYERRIEPVAKEWRSHAWNSGIFDTARRDYTPCVEGIIRTPQHVVMLTMSGSAERLEVHSDCGHRFTGPDKAGAVSFVPAGCERRLSLIGVASKWASISLDPALFEPAEDELHGRLDIGAFSNVEDPLAAAIISEFAALLARDGALDPAYCEAMSCALARHLVARYGEKRNLPALRSWKLPPWRLRRITEYVEAHLDGAIRIADLAALAGLSPGYFHRAFRETTGQTPLDFINGRRVRRAGELIRRTDASLAQIALEVGFVSPSHFTRTFRACTGINPSAWRRNDRA